MNIDKRGLTGRVKEKEKYKDIYIVTVGCLVKQIYMF